VTTRSGQNDNANRSDGGRSIRQKHKRGSRSRCSRQRFLAIGLVPFLVKFSTIGPRVVRSLGLRHSGRAKRYCALRSGHDLQRVGITFDTRFWLYGPLHRQLATRHLRSSSKTAQPKVGPDYRRRSPSFVQHFGRSKLSSPCYG
jgi:hypothetical protein